jgi:hypothetical protein
LAFYSLDNIVLLFSAILVLFMQADFAALESGMSPLNNTGDNSSPGWTRSKSLWVRNLWQGIQFPDSLNYWQRG